MFGVGGEPEALPDRGFFAQDLPKLTPKAETASELISEAVSNLGTLVAGAGFEPATFGL